VLLNVPGKGRRKNNKTNVRFPRYFFYARLPLARIWAKRRKNFRQKTTGKVSADTGNLNERVEREQSLTGY
jgi:hypothetical protein